jgi:hypothetical protein
VTAPGLDFTAQRRKTGWFILVVSCGVVALLLAILREIEDPLLSLLLFVLPCALGAVQGLVYLVHGSAVRITLSSEGDLRLNRLLCFVPYRLVIPARSIAEVHVREDVDSGGRFLIFLDEQGHRLTSTAADNVSNRAELLRAIKGFRPDLCVTGE